MFIDLVTYILRNMKKCYSFGKQYKVWILYKHEPKKKNK